jgi:hypothetical protein
MWEHRAESRRRCVHGCTQPQRTARRRDLRSPDRRSQTPRGGTSPMGGGESRTTSLACAATARSWSQCIRHRPVSHQARSEAESEYPRVPCTPTARSSSWRHRRQPGVNTLHFQPPNHQPAKLKCAHNQLDACTASHACIRQRQNTHAGYNRPPRHPHCKDFEVDACVHVGLASRIRRHVACNAKIHLDDLPDEGLE